MAEAAREPAPFTCYYHPRQAANVRCGKCGKALCAECVMHGPVGTRCVECLLGVTIAPLSLTRRGAAALAALGAALGAGVGLGFLNLSGWLAGIMLGLVAGQVTGAILPHFTAPLAQAAAGAAAAVGAYASAVVAQERQLSAVGIQSGILGRAVSGHHHR